MLDKNDSKSETREKSVQDVHRASGRRENNLWRKMLQKRLVRDTDFMPPTAEQKEQNQDDDFGADEEEIDTPFPPAGTYH